jgi:hypothetical protein
MLFGTIRTTGPYIKAILTSHIAICGYRFYQKAQLAGHGGTYPFRNYYSNLPSFHYSTIPLFQINPVVA